MRDSIDSRITNGLKAEYLEKSDNILEEARRQLDQYFNHHRKIFDVPLLMVGSEFQKRIWKRLLEIPFGETLSYRQLAEDVDNKKAVRAAASANGANAISIFIPCHRVIGNNGKLSGYAGGLKTKASLLSLEFDLFN